MTKQQIKTLTPDLSQEINLTLSELAHAVHADDEVIIEMVEYELIQPQGETPATWRFNALSLKKARVAVQFHHDLEINMNGVALALELLEQIDALQAKIQQLEKLIE